LRDSFYDSDISNAVVFSSKTFLSYDQRHCRSWKNFRICSDDKHAISTNILDNVTEPAIHPKRQT
jgi:hypothetical protein